jgi:hypothetical protein
MGGRTIQRRERTTSQCWASGAVAWAVAVGCPRGNKLTGPAGRSPVMRIEELTEHFSHPTTAWGIARFPPRWGERRTSTGSSSAAHAASTRFTDQIIFFKPPDRASSAGTVLAQRTRWSGRVSRADRLISRVAPRADPAYSRRHCLRTWNRPRRSRRLALLRRDGACNQHQDTPQSNVRRSLFGWAACPVSLASSSAGTGNITYKERYKS